MDTKCSENIWRIGLILLAATGLYFALHRSSAKSFWKRITERDRRDSTAGTPPRSISPEKKLPTSYNQALPPQRRQVLADLKIDETPSREVVEEEIHRNILPMTSDYRTARDNQYTPTGFSVQEVKALGDFPDYATLSGVPLPSQYHEFDIEKALPRPYRPFRWAYHQTMCM